MQSAGQFVTVSPSSHTPFPHDDSGADVGFEVGFEVVFEVGLAVGFEVGFAVGTTSSLSP